jgi:hypothetical protein
MCDYTQVTYQCGHVRYIVKAWCERYRQTQQRCPPNVVALLVSQSGTQLYKTCPLTLLLERTTSAKSAVSFPMTGQSPRHLSCGNSSGHGISRLLNLTRTLFILASRLPRNREEREALTLHLQAAAKPILHLRPARPLRPARNHLALAKYTACGPLLQAARMTHV